MTDPASNGVPYITWYDKPDENARWYNHYGCDGHGARWFTPLDDCLEPGADETEECAQCYAVLPLKHDALHQEPDAPVTTRPPAPVTPSVVSLQAELDSIYAVVDHGDGALYNAVKHSIARTRPPGSRG